MKKYALLVLLFCVTMVLGVLVYQTAHEHMTIASVTEEVSGREKTDDRRVNEEAFSEATKEIAREGGKSVARFLFSLIYK